MRDTKAKTNTEAVNLAVANSTRWQRLVKLADKRGTLNDMILGETDFFMLRWGGGGGMLV